MTEHLPDAVSRADDRQRDYVAVDVDLAAMANAADRARFDAEWDKFFKGYHPRLFDFFAHAVPADDERDDLIQEIFIRAYRAIAISGHTLRSTNAAWSWLVTIGKNYLRDDFAKEKTRAKILDLYAHEVAVKERLTHDANNLLHALAAEDDVDWSNRPLDETSLAIRLSELTDEERRLLHLRFIDGMEWVDVAAHIGKTPVAVRKQFSRLAAFLRDG
jgi:RNA polymerase sigma factor (sigma-70 family)